MTLATVPNAPTLQLAAANVDLRDELALWKEAFEFAQAVAGTAFVPQAIRNNPPAVMATIIRGHELGVSAMHSLSQIDFIEGKPALRSELARALVLSKGHRIWTEEYSTTRVTLCGARAGEADVQKVTWTLDDAKRANLANKQNWRQYPRAMLLARATAELCRLLFADVLAGMAYLEEVQDVVDIDGVEISAGDQGTAPPAPVETRSTTGTAKKGARKRAAPAAPAGASGGPPQPPLPGEEEQAGTEAPAAAADAPGDEAALPPAQAIAIRARRLGIDHHQVVNAVTNGATSSAKGLDTGVAQQVIDALGALEAGDVVLEVDEEGDGHDEVRWKLTTIGDARARIEGRLALVDRDKALEEWKRLKLPKAANLAAADLQRASELLDQLEEGPF